MAVAKVTLNGTTLIDNTEFKEKKYANYYN